MVACPFGAMVVVYGIWEILTSYEMVDVCDTPTVFIHLSRMFLSTDILFKTDSHGETFIYQIDISIVSRGAPGLIADSSCGVWGRGLITCLVYGALPLVLCLKQQLVCEFPTTIT